MEEQNYIVLALILSELGVVFGMAIIIGYYGKQNKAKRITKDSTIPLEGKYDKIVFIHTMPSDKLYCRRTYSQLEYIEKNTNEFNKIVDKYAPESFSHIVAPLSIIVSKINNILDSKNNNYTYYRSTNDNIELIGLDTDNFNLLLSDYYKIHGLKLKDLLETVEHKTNDIFLSENDKLYYLTQKGYV